jgi:hypothetical protein
MNDSNRPLVEPSTAAWHSALELKVPMSRTVPLSPLGSFRLIMVLMSGKICGVQ